MADNGILSARKRRFVRAMLGAPTVEKAAQAAGIGERTAWRYLSTPAVKVELRRQQDAILAATTASLVGLSGQAVQTLQDVLEDPEASYSVKVRAALGWLAHTRQAIELEALTHRVEVLEERITTGR